MKLDLKAAEKWFASQKWEAAAFQEAAWQAYAEGKNGIVNAPTGSGKTYSLLLPILVRESKGKGLRAIWITPIRALAKEIRQSAERAIEGMGLEFSVGIRTGDTSTAERNRQKKQMPNLLITTPESLHLLLAGKQNQQTFRHLHTVVVDEWHELMGSKRAVQMELALSRLRGINPQLQSWGISATIGNMEEALDVLLGPEFPEDLKTMIRSGTRKKIKVESVLPDTIEVLPWAGHLGIKMLEKVIPILEASESTLIFTNTRSQSEFLFQELWKINPNTKIISYKIKANKNNFEKILKKYDFIIDGSDNFKTKFLTNDICNKFRKCLITGAISKFEGHVFTFTNKNKKDPCLRCFLQEDKISDDILNCEYDGVLGSVAGVVGTIQANEVLKQILNIGKSLNGFILIIDLLSLNFRKVKIKMRKPCWCN